MCYKLTVSQLSQKLVKRNNKFTTKRKKTDNWQADQNAV